ncbi:urease accessory protein UreD [Mesorhizobium australicum]|uniref:Urease accessory protein UreD n=1 Tax=Mesorhizobium australicum TaxID=536018 RepID=A0A1X7N9X0_9HYPH|nr:urease accessory protein UreD [Mesorhizobium australicum]SMH33832.1 urease accessory protein [Mesorhizobium australicum]
MIRVSIPADPLTEPTLQRVQALGRLAVAAQGGRTRLERLFQQGAAKIRMPTVTTGALEAILINTAGGMTGGDRLEWEIEVGTGAAAVLTTQACEKAYRSAGGVARIRTSAQVAAGGHLAWLPQETILYDRSALHRRLDVDLAPGATALIVESVIFGRRAMGEVVTTAQFRDVWRIRSGGRLVHADAIAYDGDVAGQLSRAAVADGGTAFATVLLIAPEAEERLGRAREIVGETGGVSFWALRGDAQAANGKLLARLVASDGYDLRRRLVPLLDLLNAQAALPKVWST